MTDEAPLLAVSDLQSMLDSIEETTNAYLDRARVYLRAKAGKLTGMTWGWENETFGGYPKAYFDLTLHLDGMNVIYIGEQNRLDDPGDMLDDLMDLAEVSKAEEETLVEQFNENATEVVDKLLSDLTGIPAGEVRSYIHAAFAYLDLNGQRDGSTRLDFKEAAPSQEPLAA